MKSSALSDSEVKARLAQAEVHFSHYRWDDAIASFEAVLAARPDHSVAAQGWASAVEQKSIDEDLAQALAKVRASLAADRFDEALANLNHAQARGALSHILKYHSEIDGLRSEAQEGQEWQRRIEAAGREAETLAARRRFDQALEVLDNTLRPLSGRGWERLGVGLAALRERLWAERDVSERIQFAQAAYERQDYRLATELAANLHEELPDRDDVRRLHERAHGAWARIEDQLAAVEEALASDRADDALALLAALRSEHPRNPDWQAIALRVQTNQGREDMASGRAAMVEHSFDDAGEAFERAYAAFTSTVEIFPEHPTTPAERAEAGALRDAALSASQAMRDRAAHRWEATRQGWQVSRDHLNRAVAVRGRDFGEVAAVLDGMLGEAQAALVDLEQARLALAEGRELLDARDPGRARESFRAGLTRVEGGRWGDATEAGQLREQLTAGLRESERSQRDVKKWLAQADAAKGTERLALLRRGYERWESAPGLAARLADELLAAARASIEAGDEDGALESCEQVRELSGAPAGALEAAEGMASGIQARRRVGSALADARAAVEAATRSYLPSPEGFSQAIETLDRVATALEDAKELAPELAKLREQTEEGRQRSIAAQKHAAESEAQAAAGDWDGAAEALAAAITVLGPLAGDELAGRLTKLRKWSLAVQSALTPASEALRQADSMYAMASEGDLAAIDWDALERMLAQVRKKLRSSPELPATLPAAWEETRARAETLLRRSQVLHSAHESVAAGRGVDAIPALQADAATSSDPVVLAVLTRLLQETAGDAVAVARGWLGEASAALNRGELPSAEASLALAQSYAAAAPQLVPEIRRLERQVTSLTQIRLATIEARARAADGEMEAALTWYRRALEMATDGEAALPVETRRALNQLLDLEDELTGLSGAGQEGADNGLAKGKALLDALLDGNLSQPLAREFLAPVLPRWWKLARRAARLADVEAQMRLGRDAIALEAASALVRSYPRDRAVLDLYSAAAGQAHKRSLARLQRRLARARRLAARGAFADALEEIPVEASTPGADLAAISPPESTEEAETLAGEAADVRMELKAMEALAEQLTPLLEQARENCLAGEFGEALKARSWAAFVDPRRRASIIWDELDALAALVAERQDGQVVDAGRLNEVSAEPSRIVPPPASARTPDVARPEIRSQTLEAPPTPVAIETIEPPSNGRPSETHELEPSGRSGETPDLSARAIARQGPEAAAGAVTAETSKGSTAEAATQPSKVAPPIEVPTALEPSEPPAPFDLDDWLSNVTELGPEDGDV